MARNSVGNAKLVAAIAEAGLSHAHIARVVAQVAIESGVTEYAGIGRSHVSHWVRGTMPSGPASLILVGALSRKLQRVVTLEEIGLPPQPSLSQDGLDWHVDTLFSHVDQRPGGGHARTAVVQYLTADVSVFLRGQYADEQVRRDMFTGASELAYLSGWMGFDNGERALAQRYFSSAVKLAAEAGDPAMAAHVLRAMAHQAVDLGHRREAPGRVFFFGQASLGHETACALRDTGDLRAAISQFRLSVRTRQASSFTRTHAVTLGYLGMVQARQGDLEEACATWSRSLEAMEGVRSGRARQVAAEMRAALSPFRQTRSGAVAEVDARAERYLAIFS